MSKREQILATATSLFGRQSFNATGMDQIVRESGVTKKTIYSYFSSKDELILAVLGEFEIRHRSRLMTGVKEFSSDPRERLIVLFDVCKEWFEESSFQGCLLIAASIEFSSGKSRIKEFTTYASSQLGAHFEQMAIDAEIADSQGLVKAWLLLYEGATLLAHLNGSSDPATQAKVIAENLLEHRFS